MFLLRVKLPDRPGSLGRVATALGTAGADISAVEIVERGEGYAIDDFMLSAPDDTKPDSLVTACAGLDEVAVLWVSRYPESWNIDGDVDVLNSMTDDPINAERTLAEAAPNVFHCAWSLVVDRTLPEVVWHTPLAPELRLEKVALLGDLASPRVGELPEGWVDGWGATAIAVAPFRDNRSVVLGRNGGPEFLPSELARLRHLAQLADVR